MYKLIHERRSDAPNLKILKVYIKKVAIFGSTGSIGNNTINIIKKFPEKYKVEILVAHNNVESLAKQVKELRPSYACIIDETKLETLKILLKDENIKIFSGVNGLLELAQIKLDIVMMAIMGAAAILPTIRVIEAGNNIALANKECLVCAGNIITKLAKKNNVQIIPVDSEHNALFQIFDFKNPELIKNVTLTASGGPFRDFSLEQMKSVTKAQALKHPNWSMGAKITIDSASLVNKCLEVIEAYHLFPITTNQIKIVIHPESIVHAMATYKDGSVLAALSKPNMQIPISFALSYPDRNYLAEFNEFDLTEISKLHFYTPDKEKFGSLKLLDSVLASIESNSSLIFNVANEIAVEAFLNDKINFSQIIQVIDHLLNKIPLKKLDSLEETLAEIEKVRIETQKYINHHSSS
ncbi:MAG: 1-deoxy-D-xylulose-5-phosphate reductoisomerase [Pseudomonadota bacterium]